MANSWIKYFRNESDNELAISLPVSFVDNTSRLKSLSKSRAILLAQRTILTSFRSTQIRDWFVS